MKKLIILVSVALSLTSVIAQTPQAFKYQAVARDSSGIILANQSVSFRISILKSNISGTVVYSETHNPTTNNFGLVNLNIGKGSVVSGTFSTINWGKDDYFVKIELDALGGTNYQLMGTSQLLSVPYALYAEKTGNIDDADADSTNELQILSIYKDTLRISDGNFVNLDFDRIDRDSTNELQILSMHNDSLQITKGNTVNLDIDRIDRDSTNELQTLLISGNQLQISKGNSVNLDPDPTNEIQTISISNDTIFLSNGGKIKLPSNNALNLDKDIRLLITEGAYVVNDTLWYIIPDYLLEFNKNNYSNIDSIIFVVEKASSSNSTCFFLMELWDVTNNKPIANSQLSTNKVNKILRSGNLISYLPNTKITLGIIIKVNSSNCTGSPGYCWLFLKRK